MAKFPKSKKERENGMKNRSASTFFSMAGQKWEAELGPVLRVKGFWVGELGGTQLPTTNSLLGGAGGEVVQQALHAGGTGGSSGTAIPLAVLLSTSRTDSRAQHKE